MTSYRFHYITAMGRFGDPGIIGTPVMKSFVKNGRRTIERAHDGIRLAGSLSKWIGTKTTGICEIFRVHPASAIVCERNG